MNEVTASPSRWAQFKTTVSDKWNDPKIRNGVGTVTLVAGPIFLALGAAALALHIRGIQLLGHAISLEDVTLLIAMSALITLKGLHWRAEASELTKRAKKGERLAESDIKTADDLKTSLDELKKIIEIPKLADTNAQKVIKTIALIAGVALLGLFAYQVTALVRGTAKFESQAVSLIAATAVLGTSLTLITQYLLREKKEVTLEIDSEKAADNVEKRPKLENATLRTLPRALGYGGLILGSGMLLLAVVSLGLHYGGGINKLNIFGHSSELSGSMIGQVAFAGLSTAGAGIWQLSYARSTKKLRKEDTQKEKLETEVAELRLVEVATPLKAKTQEELDKVTRLRATRETARNTRHIAQRVLGILAIVGAVTFIGLQIASLAGAKLDIGHSAVTMVSMLGAAGALGFVAGELLNDSAHNKEYEELVMLEAEKRELQLRHQASELQLDLLNDL